MNEGVTPARIKTVGFGDSDPIKASDVEESNTLSRRVVAQVVGSQENIVKEWTVYSVREN
ncbi:hypothetical protein [Photobacterium carnosum]|uniref:hypothetical protein n=1 Tax=Photobacterium carnosum TaxID=2023717 RepID=UPI001E2F35CD